MLRAGITLVMLDRIVSPPANGGRPDIGMLITMLIDYDRSGKDVHDLAAVCLVQLGLAELGSTDWRMASSTASTAG